MARARKRKKKKTTDEDPIVVAEGLHTVRWRRTFTETGIEQIEAESPEEAVEMIRQKLVDPPPSNTGAVVTGKSIEVVESQQL